MSLLFKRGHKIPQDKHNNHSQEKPRNIRK